VVPERVPEAGFAGGAWPARPSASLAATYITEQLENTKRKMNDRVVYHRVFVSI
jgi:hypothetical protein